MSPRRAIAIAALACAACGYRAVYGPGAAGERFHVRLARAPVTDAIAAGEVVSGAREELAREGALAGGEGVPCVEIEVTRIDESSDAIAARAGPGGAQVPRARGTEVGVVARGWIVRTDRARGAGERERDTGDVRALDVSGASTSTGPAVDAFHHEDAVRASARRAGVLLARRILGRPAPADESP